MFLYDNAEMIFNLVNITFLCEHDSTNIIYLGVNFNFFLRNQYLLTCITKYLQHQVVVETQWENYKDRHTVLTPQLLSRTGLLLDYVALYGCYTE